MPRGWWWAVAFPAAILPAQVSTPARIAPHIVAEHVFADGLRLEAEFLHRNVSWKGRSYFVPGCLVVKVRFWGRATPIEVAPGQFFLQVNKRRDLLPTSPELVVYQMRRGYSPAVVLGAPGGPSIILGGPDPSPRFPGDPRSNPRQPPRVPDSQTQPETPEEPPLEVVLQQAALPAKLAEPPIEGHLYFPYKQALKGVKQLDLVYRGPAGEARLVLIPPQPRP